MFDMIEHDEEDKHEHDKLLQILRQLKSKLER